jgi:hypothetical protein
VYNGRMAQFFTPWQPSVTAYHGLPGLFGYVNQDGRLCGTNCGLAASATLLTHFGKMEQAPTLEPATNPNMKTLEASFPPNILGGLAGTSRGRVERILDAYGCDSVEIDGEEALRESLSAGQPVAVMLQVPGNQVLGIAMPAGHWMVAYSYDAEKVYLTNWNEDAMLWEEFRRGWSALFPWCINMQRKGLRARMW